jgi:hypothetical protein
MDSKLVELIGRNFLTAELLKAGLEVATPARDRGIDLIAYVDLDREGHSFRAWPIQLKAALNQAFSIDRKYAKFPDLLLAYVWDLHDLPRTQCFVMSHAESVAIGDAMGWTKTASWKKGYYVTTRPSKKLLGLLTPYRVRSGGLHDRITSHTADVR